jgi:hypothetical protein
VEKWKSGKVEKWKKYRYPVAALWIFGGFPLLALLLAAVVMAVGRLGLHRPLRGASSPST